MGGDDADAVVDAGAVSGAVLGRGGVLDVDGAGVVSVGGVGMAATTFVSGGLRTRRCDVEPAGTGEWTIAGALTRTWCGPLGAACGLLDRA